MQSVHSNERPYKCEICGSGYITDISDLKLTFLCYRITNNDGTFSISHIIFSFKVKGNLKTHHLTHLDAQHRCNECHKAFKSKYSLKMHLETHTGVVTKPHVCDFCGKGFRTNAELQVSTEI